jgi:drug/metabolite transporter (DMT)-like permease
MPERSPASPEVSPRRSGLSADAVLVGVTALWGLSFVIVKNVVAEAPPVTFLLLRFLVAFALLAAAAARRRFDRRVLRDGAAAGLLLASGMVLQVIGQVETTASKAAFLTGLSVVLTPFAAYVRARRLPSVENAAGIGLASVGFFLLSLPAAGGPVNRGDLLMLGCGVLFAFYIVELGERGPSHDALTLTVVQMGTVVLFAAAAALLLRVVGPAHLGIAGAETRPVTWDRTFVASVLFLGSVGTVATFFGQTWAQRRMSATHAAILFALEPVFAALLAAWLLGERLGRRAVAGGVIVLAGIVVSELRLGRQRPVTGGR